MIERIHFQGTSYTPSEFASYKGAHPEAFLPPEPVEPTIEHLRARKLSELVTAKTQAESSGVTTSIGLTMKYGENDVVLVDGVIRYAELRSLSTIPKLIEADGTIHTDISLTDGKTVLMEQFEAAYAADDRISSLKPQIDAATTADELEAITW
ncbi:hypothetical protein L2W58_02010 [Dethiosulfovibrio sp. F2B]|uniref:hypothetical protein n=1 Tax=Dethiosulfovibrio faecalis TaxID=2720018 RepID=UPI001F3DD103|nr:hypothetical protein [Dethiosulfovibrio faecalis]MCF4150567.1 hypothetical protein [Dethiosulfovibrio faecalis]